jgi:hypothetical protein
VSRNPKKRIETPLIVAIIGLIAALLSSPLVFKFVESLTAPPTPTNAPNQVVVFTEDFEDDSIDGLAIQTGQWIVGRDKSNKVVDVQADPSSPALASFSPADFADGMIDFRIQFLTGGGFSLKLRDSDGSAYVLRFEPDSLSLGYNGPDSGGHLLSLPGNSASGYNFIIKQWYAIHFEARGEQLTVTVDGDRLRLATSDDRLVHGASSFSLDPGGHLLLDDIRVSAFEP